MAYQRTAYVESKRAEARDRFVQAALTLLGEGGWRAVQMSAVAALAGLSTGALYLHFPSKTALLTELYRVQAGKELAFTAEIAAQPGPARERLADAIGTFAQRAVSGGRLAYALVVEPTDTEVEELRLHFHAQFIELFRRILDSGCAAGEFRVSNTQVVAACVFGCVTESLMHPLGLAMASGRKGRAAAGATSPAKRLAARLDRAALVDPLLDFCFNGVAGAPAPARSGAAPKRGRKPAPRP